MKICIVASSYPRFQGDIAGVFVRSLAEALQDLGHELHVLAPFNPAVAPQGHPRIPVTHFKFAPLRNLHRMGYAEALVNDRDLRRRSYFLLPFYLLCGSLALLRLCREKSFDLINSHWVVPNTPMCLLSSKRNGIPIVTTLHGSDVYLSKKSLPASLAARVSFKRSAAVTSCSEEFKYHAITLGAAPNSVHVIPWGVHGAMFRYGDGNSWRRILGISTRAPVLLAVGRAVEKKGFEYFVKSAPAILESIPDAVFVIAGAGEQLERLRQLARDLGLESSSRFPGAIPWTEMPNILNMCDVFVAPSIHDASGNVDGLPTVVPEAMASGKPIVATTTGGIPLVIKHGINGLLVDEKKSGQLSEAMLTILQDEKLKSSMSAENLRVTETELTWKNTAVRFQEVFNQVLRTKHEAHIALGR